MAHYDGYVEAAREQYIAKLEARVRELVDEGKAISRLNVEQAVEVGNLKAKVREYHEKYVHQDLLSAEQDKVRELEERLRQVVAEGKAISRLNVEQAVEIGNLKAKLRQVEDGLAGKGELNMTLFKLCNPITVQQVDSPTHMRQLEEGALIFLEDAYASISGPPNVDAPITWEEERYRTLQNKMRQVEEDIKEASGLLMVDVPEPGTDMAKVMQANRLLRTERDRLREALQTILTTHCAYPDLPTPYQIGVTDGHRCAANMAREALKEERSGR